MRQNCEDLSFDFLQKKKRRGVAKEPAPAADMSIGPLGAPQANPASSFATPLLFFFCKMPTR
jgi:hypothetical protein